MTERRLPNTRPTPRLERGDEPPRPTCDGEYELFFAFIDSPSNFILRKEAAKFCRPCPLRDSCLPKHIALGGDDAAWATAIVKELERVKTRDCDYCGKAMELKPNAGNRKRFCDDVCGHLARAARRAPDLDTIPTEVRTAHATHVRLRNNGTPVDQIPANVRNGERAYQSMRHQARKARVA